MAESHPPDPVLLVVAAFSRHAEALDWAQQQLEQSFGPVALASEPFVFNQTAYYAPEMGTDLRKRFFVFRDLVEPDCLARTKLLTNGLELDLARTGGYPEARPLNLD